MANRKIILTRDKKFIGGGADYLVYLDGECLGRIDNGDTASRVVSSNQHVIYVYGKFTDRPVRSDEIYIPENDLDYHYHIVTTSGLFSGHIELQEDSSQASYNRDILEKRRIQNNIISRVDSVIKPIIKSGKMGERNFEAINTLTAEYINSDYYKEVINMLRNEYYKTLATKSFSVGMSHLKIYQVLKEISIFTRENIATFESLRHYDYMVIDNNIFNSVLSIDTIEDLRKIMNKEPLKELSEDFLMTYHESKRLCDLGFYEKSINRLLFTKFTDDDLDNAKRWLLYASMDEGAGKEASDFYNVMLKFNKTVFGDSVLDENNRTVEIKSVDMIIAESIRLSSVNSIDKINEPLDDFLNIGCKYFNVDKEQYNILINIFTYLNAYKQEEMVLEAMVSNCIERTPEQEERLRFLKNKKNNFVNNEKFSYTPTVEDAVTDNGFVYEYRSITWKENDIVNYFDALSMQNQTVLFPFVINEWTKNITVNGIKWSIENVANRINEVLIENFGEKFKVNIVESGPTGEYVDFDKTALIVNKLDTGYPWITFNVIGEQMMKNQITLSVYAMYTPAFDDNLGKSNIERNMGMCNKLLMLNQKQNPKINNYMTNLTDLIIKELEKWINNQNESNIYS